jgi:hypothetical protein
MNNGSDPLIRLNSVTKVFLTDEVETHALSGIPPGHSAWRICFHSWTIGLRQDDLAVNSRVARYSLRTAATR